MRLHYRATSALFTLLLSSTTWAQDLQIKEFWIGMPLADYKWQTNCIASATGRNCLDGFPANTLGGEDMKSTFLVFDGKDLLESFLITFDAASYAQVRRAVSTKFRRLRCAPTKVQNLLGATFSSETCTLEGKTSYLILERHGESIEECSLFVGSKAAREAEKAREKNADKDI